MISLVIVVILWTYVLAMMARRAPQARTPIRDGSPQACADPRRRARSGADIQDGQVWSTLDDHQLTRLLTDSAPRTTSE